MDHCSFQCCKSQTKRKASGFPAEVFLTLSWGDAGTKWHGRLSKTPGLPVAGVEQFPAGSGHPNYQQGSTEHWACSVPAMAEGTTKASLRLLFGFIRERRAAVLVLYIWGTVSFKATRYNTRIILSNWRLVFVAFFFNFPAAIHFHFAHGHIQQCRHLVLLGKAQARIQIKQKNPNKTKQNRTKKTPNPINQPTKKPWVFVQSFN